MISINCKNHPEKTLKWYSISTFANPTQDYVHVDYYCPQDDFRLRIKAKYLRDAGGHYWKDKKIKEKNQKLELAYQKGLPTKYEVVEEKYFPHEK